MVYRPPAQTQQSRLRPRQGLSWGRRGAGAGAGDCICKATAKSRRCDRVSFWCRKAAADAVADAAVAAYRERAARHISMINVQRVGQLQQHRLLSQASWIAG